jgi:hypothetical protein
MLQKQKSGTESMEQYRSLISRDVCDASKPSNQRDRAGYRRNNQARSRQSLNPSRCSKRSCSCHLGCDYGYGFYASCASYVHGYYRRDYQGTSLQPQQTTLHTTNHHGAKSRGVKSRDASYGCHAICASYASSLSCRMC